MVALAPLACTICLATPVHGGVVRAEPIDPPPTASAVRLAPRPPTGVFVALVRR